MFQMKVVEKIKTRIFMKSFFSFENRPVYEIMWRARTHTQMEICNAVPQQQWFSGRSSV
jgi:hypothetical protein